MNSPLARLLKLALRVQRPLLRRINHPAQLGLVHGLMTRTAFLPAQATARRTRTGSVPVLEILNQRADRRAGQVLVYVHGGGFAIGSPDSHRAFAARLMQAGAFEKVLMPQYRLTPEHPWPAGLDDVEAFWRALLVQSPAAVFCLAGESAGANLCLSLCLRVRDAGLTLPARLYLHSPWLDVSLSGDSYHDTRLEDGFTGRRRSRKLWLHHVFARHYAGANDSQHPHISPVFADLAGLPPIYVQTGAKELFLDDSRTLAARCRTAGTSCELEIWPGMWHAFALFAPLLPEANRALARAGRWLNTTPR
ncbi:MAG: alpha/beta hydrolase [bacterium]|nr:alpha/beta hydrolase [bacterium]